MPNCKGPNSRIVLVKFVKIIEREESLIRQTLLKVEPSKVKWAGKFVQKRNLTLLTLLTIRHGRVVLKVNLEY